jgi:ABC-type phosphate/phosphonate transport system substrate-binding protein
MSAYLTQRCTRTPGIWKRLCVGFAVTLVAVGYVLLTPGENVFADESNNTMLRVGFSSSMFTDVNENDARASMKVWAEVLFKERGLPIDPEMTLMNSSEEIARAVRSKLVDALALTTQEYWALQKEMHSSHIVVSKFDGHFGEEYLVLVHRESGIERIADLRGHSVTFFLNPRMSLASAWLDTALAKEGLGRTSKFFGRVTQFNRLPRVILPVFFRQSDACVVTRRGFQTMSELNPQVGRQLKVIASSPELVPGGLFFRDEFSRSVRDKVFAELDKLHTTPAGQQALTVFQSGRLEVQPISILNSSFELLARHSR